MKSVFMDKIQLLAELQEFITNALGESHASRFGSILEKKHNRKLKRLRKELDTWIEELMEDAKNKQ